MKNTVQVCRASRLIILSLSLLTTVAFAAGKKTPTSKLYIADLDGQSEIDTGERIEDLRSKSVHNAQGTIIETKANSNNSMVFSNGTGVFLDQDTRLEVQQFSQEPFTPNRTDLETEPSISQTRNYIPRGRVGICAPRMVAGSSMVYATPHGSASIRGKKVVVESQDFETIISSVEGEVTVKGDGGSGGGRTIKGGEQAVIRQLPGQAPTIVVQPIPDDQREMIEDKVAMACNARRTVYFDVAQKKSEMGKASGEGPGEDNAKTPDSEEEDPDAPVVVKEDGLTPGGLDELFLEDTTGTDESEDFLVPVVVTPVGTAPDEVVGSASAIQGG
jgi:hypothetical protein